VSWIADTKRGRGCLGLIYESSQDSKENSFSPGGEGMKKIERDREAIQFYESLFPEQREREDGAGGGYLICKKDERRLPLLQLQNLFDNC
jgi:hypothetical protein